MLLLPHAILQLSLRGLFHLLLLLPPALPNAEACKTCVSESEHFQPHPDSLAAAARCCCMLL
jgi:hypothetical protein